MMPAWTIAELRWTSVINMTCSRATCECFLLRLNDDWTPVNWGRRKVWGSNGKQRSPVRCRVLLMRCQRPYTEYVYANFLGITEHAMQNPRRRFAILKYASHHFLAFPFFAFPPPPAGTLLNAACLFFVICWNSCVRLGKLALQVAQV